VATPIVRPVAAVSFEGVAKSYGDRAAVEPLWLTLAAGECFGLIGPNGAGKTTAIKLAVGLLRPSAGRIRIAGHDVHRDGVASRRVTGYVPDHAALYEKLTGQELLELAADLHGVPAGPRRIRIAAALRALDLESARRQLIQTYSRGMRQKLALAAALLHDPKVVILDEPTVGLDPRSGRQLRAVLGGLCARGRTVLLSTHSLEVAAVLCDRVGIFDHGRLVACGTVAELAAAGAGPGSTSSALEAAVLALTGDDREGTELLLAALAG